MLTQEEGSLTAILFAARRASKESREFQQADVIALARDITNAYPYPTGMKRYGKTAERFVPLFFVFNVPPFVIHFVHDTFPHRWGDSEGRAGLPPHVISNEVRNLMNEIPRRYSYFALRARADLGIEIEASVGTVAMRQLLPEEEP